MLARNVASPPCRKGGLGTLVPGRHCSDWQANTGASCPGSIASQESIARGIPGLFLVQLLAGKREEPLLSLSVHFCWAQLQRQRETHLSTCFALEFTSVTPCPKMISKQRPLWESCSVQVAAFASRSWHFEAPCSNEIGLVQIACHE